jgi:tetratricopeptide (TPR) repeat protein
MVTYLDNAIAACEQALQNQVNVTPACQTLGNVLQSMGKFEEAMHWHTRSVAPQFVEAEDYVQLGSLYAQQQQWQQAIARYEVALQVDPTSTSARWGLADALSGNGKTFEALEHWYQVLVLSPYEATAEGHCSLGNLFKQYGDWERAKTCYKQAIDQDSACAEAYYQLAEYLKTLGCWNEAIERYRQAIVLDPHFPWSRFSLTEILLQQEQWDEVIAVSESTIALQQDLPWAYSQLGRAFLAQGRMTQAIASHQQGSAARGWHRCLENEYQFTHDWFTHNIPIWQEHLSPFADAPQIAGLEVGSFEGMATCWLVDQILTHPSASMTCIDLGFLEQFDLNIDRAGAALKVKKLVGDSHQILPLLPANSYDMVYIDGCPLASHLYKDAVLAWSLLKLGGLMILDDYEWIDRQNPEQSPKIGIDDFLSDTQSELEILHRAYQVIVKKTST